MAAEKLRYGEPTRMTRFGTRLGTGALAACLVDIDAWFPAPGDAPPTSHTYYIAADEVD